MENYKLKIYIAEDEPLVLMGFQAMVEDFGYEVIGTASDGLTARDEILALKPDLIMTDINMPGMDGISLIEEVNAQMQVPAIILTGYRSDTYVERAIEAGVYGYLQKPVDEYELKSAIKILYKKYKDIVSAQKGQELAERKLKERKVIERAKGLLMERFGLSDEQAMKAMQRKCGNENKKLFVIAQEILKSGEMF